MSRKILFVLLVTIVSFSLAVSAQTVDDLIKKNIEAKGGYKVAKSIKSIKMTGTLKTQGIEASLTYLNKRPHFLWVELSAQGQTMVRGYDGKTAWWINPFIGITDPQELPENQAKDVVEQADIDGSLVDYKKKGHQIELIGKEDMDGKKVYNLKITLNNGNTRNYYLDAESFLEKKIAYKTQARGMEFDIEVLIDDYKKVDGFLFPHTYKTKRNGILGEQVSLEKYEINTEIDNSIFSMPQKSEAEKKTQPK